VITDVNNYFFKFTSSENPVGRSIYEIDFFIRENLISQYESVFEKGEQFARQDCKTVNKEGKTKYLNIFAVPLLSPYGAIEGAISMATDFTETHLTYDKLLKLNRSLNKEIEDRQSAEKEANKLSEINQKILDNVPVGIVMIDNAGSIVAANRMAAKLMGRAEQELVGMEAAKASDFGSHQELRKKLISLLADGKPFYFDDFLYSVPGKETELHLNILAVPLYDGSKNIEGGIAMATDNTEAVEAKKKLSELAAQLDQEVKKRTKELFELNKKLSETLDLKSKFVADASHELRTPLTVIKGNLELAARAAKRKNKPVPELNRLISEEVDRMNSVISDMEALSDSENGKMRIRCEKTDVHSLIRALEKSLSVIAADKEVSFRWADGSEKAEVFGDGHRLEKLFSNILRNAVKYSNRGGNVKISVLADKYEAVVTIKDEGIGIPEQDIPYVFERFYRVDKERIRDEEGSGLGLSIAKMIADAHYGSISVQSEHGKGSSFTVRLPLDYRKNTDTIASVPL
jgi:PAS domain S-box-containing protein